MTGKKIYDELVRIAEDYLGPAAPRFVARQVKFHLDKEPSDLTVRDIAPLESWVRVSVGLLTEDKQMANEFAMRVSKVGGNDDRPTG